jgi:hypothetical protein
MLTFQSNRKEWLVEVSDIKLSFQEIPDYLRELGDRWRLPTRNELAELIDRKYSPTINPVNFPSCPPGIFWSSSVWENNPSYRWTIDFSTGDSWGIPVDSKNRIRCIRSIV